MPRITIRVSESSHASLRSRARLDGRTAADLARHLINRGLEVPEPVKLDKRRNPRLKGL